MFQNNGQANIPAAIGLLGIAKLAQGAIRQHGNNSDIAMYNQALPQGYQLPTSKGIFNFGDPATNRAANAALYKAQYDKYQNDLALQDYNNQGQRFGMAPFHSADAAKTILGPYQGQDAQFLVPGNYGRGAILGSNYLNQVMPPQGASQNQPEAQPEPYTTGLPVGATPGGTPLWDDTQKQPPLLTGGATQIELPPIPQDAYITPDMVKQHQDRLINQQNANTSTRAQNLREQEYNTIKVPESKLKQRQTELQTKKIQQEIENIKQIMSLRPAESRARIASLARKFHKDPSQLSVLLSKYSTDRVAKALMGSLEAKAGIFTDDEAPTNPTDPKSEADGYLGED